MAALKWFGQDAYFAIPRDNYVDFFTAKWGRTDFSKTDPHEAFVFHWRVEPTANGWRAIQVMPKWEGKDFREALSKLWHRILEKPTSAHTP